MTSIVEHPSPATTAPTPTPACTYGWDPCGRPAVLVFGVIRSCGCPPSATRFACELHDFDDEPHRCRFCRKTSSEYRVEPVRLRGAASDGRTE